MSVNKKELLDSLKEMSRLMNVAMSAEENPFGIHHNDATDAIGVAEVLIARAGG